MAGLYLHIPFCRDACHYCDFHFSIALSHMEPMLKAIEAEMGMRRDFLKGASLKTIYFGGGTPSLVSIPRLAQCLRTIRRHFPVRDDAEITMEANPDDLHPAYLKSLKSLGVNRLSLGIQSFHAPVLKMMNRRHTAAQAKKSIADARQAGFRNISIDLIYGFPGQSQHAWTEDLRLSLEHRPEHLAAYHLSFEPGTVLDYRKRKNLVRAQEDELSFQQYKTAVELLQRSGYEHYEISNFCREGFRSRHNTAYWNGTPYLGVGPSAHSYNGSTRSWNMARNSSYIRGIMEGRKVWEEEALDVTSRFNECLMISLRTREGLDLVKLRDRFGEEKAKHVLARAAPFIQSRRAKLLDQRLALSTEGMFIADHIISRLFAGE